MMGSELQAVVDKAPISMILAVLAVRHGLLILNGLAMDVVRSNGHPTTDVLAKSWILAKSCRIFCIALSAHRVRRCCPLADAS